MKLRASTDATALISLHAIHGVISAQRGNIILLRVVQYLGIQTSKMQDQSGHVGLLHVNLWTAQP